MKVGGRRAYERARAGEEVRRARARGDRLRASSELWREGDRAGLRVECSSGTYVRTSSPTSATPTARSCGARAIGPFDVARRRPDRASCALGDALAFLPARAPRGRDARPRRRAVGRAVRGAGARRRTRGRACCSSTTTGPIAIAEPRDGGAQARRRLPRVKRRSSAARRRAAPAPRRRRHVRRRAPRPPRGDRRRRHRADVRPAPASRSSHPATHAAPADDARAQGASWSRRSASRSSS